MSAFWIFAAIVTVVYAIYYAVIISIDLYGKKETTKQTTVETFDIKDLPTESSRTVEVTEGGFRIGGSSEGDGSERWSETTLKPSSVPTTSETEPPPKLDASGAPITPAQEKIKETQKEMEEILPDMSSEMMLATSLSAFETGKPPVQIKKEVIKPDQAGTEKDNSTSNEERSSNDQCVPRDHI